MCFREGPQQFLTSVFSFFPFGGHCEDKIPGEGSRNAGHQGRTGVCPSCDCEAILALKVLMESSALSSPTFQPCACVRCQSFSSWEWKSVKPGGKFIDFRSYAIRSASVTNDLAKQSLAFPTEHLETKIEPCKELTPSTAREHRQGTNPFWKNSVMGSGKVAVQGDWRLV